MKKRLKTNDTFVTKSGIIWVFTFHQRLECAISLIIESSSVTKVAEGKKRKKDFFPIKGIVNNGKINNPHITLRVVFISTPSFSPVLKMAITPININFSKITI